MSYRIGVLIIDDTGLMRDGICALLEAQADFNVVGTLTDAAEVARIPPARAPDIVIINLAATIRGRRELLPEIAKCWPATHRILLTGRRDERLLGAAVRPGVDIQLGRTASGVQLISAIRRLAQQQSGRASGGPMSSRVRRDGEASARRSVPQALTEREFEVIKLIAGGYRTREIASRLLLSPKTIEKHRSNLMRKLGLRSATAVTAYAIAHGFITL